MTKLVLYAKPEVINDATFISIEFDVEMVGQRLPLKMFVIAMKGYSVTVSIGSLDPKMREQLEASFRTIKFFPK